MMHEYYMQRCLQLAKLGMGDVAPNPMVGAVLVHEATIIGEGFHQKFGAPHAEVNCINSVKEKDRDLISKSILYVSLEPCAHFGKTPPCADLIIQHKIPEVIIGCRDPFIEVNGKGIENLIAAGVKVVTGILENECKELNKRFFCFHTKQRPYIILKWAQSADGKIGNKDKRIPISNEFTNRLVHKWRSEETSILAGTNTVLTDDPELTTRLWDGNDPIRLVIDMNLKLPSSLKVFNNKAKTILFNKLKNEQCENIEFCKLKENENLVQQIIVALYERRIQTVIVEGGAKLLQSFIDENLWDEVRRIENRKLKMGDGVSAPVLSNAELIYSGNIFSDKIDHFRNTFAD
ncbi:MAG: bifunctional diaminohydroxyphosphoribosylaminopyrimidine deaminase/5-amino-6-(5-phosphoribosylamino)uracil reductase RibD [Bacteroidota bacterium]